VDGTDEALAALELVVIDGEDGSLRAIQCCGCGTVPVLEKPERVAYSVLTVYSRLLYRRGLAIEWWFVIL
jgi:hypothetical protein